MLSIPGGALALILLTNIVIIGVWDIYCLALNNGKGTVSEIVQAWARTFPILAFSTGMIVGHLFWPVSSHSLGPPLP